MKERDIKKVINLSLKIRKHALNMTSIGNSSHIGSVLSIADILAVLYGEILNINPKNPGWEKRDRFILSKGHAGAGVYAALAETGFFPTELLKDHYKNGSILSGHVSHKGVAGVEFSTGSLGHGLGVATGMAFAGKRDLKKHRVFVLLSDGECDEGSNWEAIMFAAHHRLSNLCAIVDYNKLQSLTSISNTLELEPLVEKWQAFGWEVVEANGHEHEQIIEALSKRVNNQRPLCLIAHTVKGKGISFMENKVLWHYRSPDKKELKAALKELDDA